MEGAESPLRELVPCSLLCFFYAPLMLEYTDGLPPCLKQSLSLSAGPSVTQL